MDATASGALHRTKTLQRTVKSCGPGAATLALPAGACSRTTGARKAASPGRARISRKAIARGKPGCPGCTCSSTRVHSFTTLAHGTAGAVGARLSLRPLPKRGTTKIAQPGRKRAAGMTTLISSSPRRPVSAKASPGFCTRGAEALAKAAGGAHTPRRMLACAMAVGFPLTTRNGGMGPGLRRGDAGMRRKHSMASPEFLQRPGNPGQLLVDGRHLILQRLDLRPARGIERADGGAAGGTLHQRQFAALADRGEQRQLKTVSAAFAAGRNRRLLLLDPIA
jgi:hypothetical protein